MKYLGVVLAEHLTWSPQISYVPMKLNRAIEILRKVPHKHSYTQNGIPFSLWNSFSLFLPVMGLKQQRNTKSILNSPKQTTEKIVFKNRYESADSLYKNLKVIKFQDLLRLNNCLFMCQLAQN